MSEENGIEQLKKENKELKDKINKLREEFDKVLQNVQTYIEAQEMQKQGLLSQLSEKVQKLNKTFSQNNVNMQ